MTNNPTRAQPVFEPWPGPKREGGVSGHRVLVLGESHYHSCDTDEACREETKREHRHRTLTSSVVATWKEHPRRSPVSYRVPLLFDMPKREFWEHVVFYNFLQTFAGPQAGHRPRREQWADPQSASAFQTVLDTFEPDRILVLGKSTWAHRPSDPAPLISAPKLEPGLPLPQRFQGKQEADGFACWYTSHTGKRALAIPVLHPAAHGFHVAEWAAPVQTWLHFAS